MKKNEISYKSESEEKTSPYLRKGVVGGWKSYFTPELNERFEKEVLQKIKGTGLEFDFEAYYERQFSSNRNNAIAYLS